MDARKYLESDSAEYTDKYNNPSVLNGASKQGSIPRAYNDLAQNLESVQKYVEELEMRLSGILRPSVPTATEVGHPREQPACGLAESIQSDAIRLESVAQQLQHILNRIEL